MINPKQPFEETLFYKFPAPSSWGMTVDLLIYLREELEQKILDEAYPIAVAFAYLRRSKK